MAEYRINKVHFIGIGGVGMSGIARVAKEKGMEVSGSDLRESRYTQQLREAGVKIFIGQSASNLEGLDPDVVVVSTAILENNAELIEAKKRNLPIWHRAKMLAALGVGHDTLAVAGTHGKTTTSSMLASTLDAMGFDPTFLIGGIVRAYGSNAHCGKGEYYVVEADESDKSFTYLDPTSVLVTNIEADHLDHYSGLDEIYQLFGDFMGSVHEDGFCVVCGEDAGLVETAKKTGKKVLTYGFPEKCDTVVSQYETHGVSISFTVTLPDGTVLPCSIKQNPGRHNALNAAGVLTLLMRVAWICRRLQRLFLDSWVYVVASIWSERPMALRSSTTMPTIQPKSLQLSLQLKSLISNAYAWCSSRIAIRVSACSPKC